MAEKIKITGNVIENTKQPLEYATNTIKLKSAKG
jgi:hypothetical protein